MKQHLLIETRNGFLLDDRGEFLIYLFFKKYIFRQCEAFLQMQGRILQKDGFFSLLIKKEKKKR